jgi:hypothetical protein
VIGHNVYFTLKDDSAEACAKLLAGCQSYLTNHPGELSFACGALAEGFERPVNDRDWDVSLHIVFADKGAHDAYQDSTRHHQFVAEFQPNWVRARVFDTELA